MPAYGQSHPVWVRGLKPVYNEDWSVSQLSHPVWVRGLKQPRAIAPPILPEVAPRVGAWIETFENGEACAIFAVAPRVGAWIETPSSV